MSAFARDRWIVLDVMASPLALHPPIAAAISAIRPQALSTASVDNPWTSRSHGL
jgi:hypothetical protein